jgi:hypothetical protein
MDRQRVDSSNVAAIGYYPNARILEVEFHSRALYEYRGVPPAEYEALMCAASIGRYLSARIKGRYPYRRIR